ncbi:hypothetical protein ATANTOWER_013476, partial [Ataeniobius toweri]|nr:hypothetical protein [Ataeniobius toweri]
KAEQSRDEAISRLLDEARSLTNKEQLETFKQNLQKAVDEAFRLKVEIKENIQKLQHDAERRKAGNMVDHAFIAELMEDAPKLIDLLRKLIKKVVPEFLPFHEAFYVFHEDIKGALGEIHVYMNKESEKEIGKIKDYEDKLTQLDMIITNLAGREADLVSATDPVFLCVFFFLHISAVMAAIPKDRRRGVSGRNPNCLLFILTLLSLVCFIRAQSDREMREKYKSQISTSSERMKTFLKNWISMMAMVKKTTAEFPDAFPPMEKIMEATKVFLEKAVVYFDKKFEEILKKR